MNWKLIAAWVAALAATTLIAWQTVSVADSRVNAQPVTVSSPIPTVEPTSDVTTSTNPTTSTTEALSSTTSVPGGSSSTTTPGTSSTSTSTPSSTSTTSVDADWNIRTITSQGGVVIVRFRPGEVELQAATPLAGYDVEVDDAGPPRVRVEFDGISGEIRVEAEWKDGGLDVEVTEHG